MWPLDYCMFLSRFQFGRRDYLPWRITSGPLCLVLNCPVCHLENVWLLLSSISTCRKTKPYIWGIISICFTNSWRCKRTLSFTEAAVWDVTKSAHISTGSLSVCGWWANTEGLSAGCSPQSKIPVWLYSQA